MGLISLSSCGNSYEQARVKVHMQPYINVAAAPTYVEVQPEATVEASTPAGEMVSVATPVAAPQAQMPANKVIDLGSSQAKPVVAAPAPAPVKVVKPRVVVRQSNTPSSVRPAVPKKVQPLMPSQRR